MNIGIISDTHGDILQLKKALNILSNCEKIIHCGDVLYHGPRNDLPKNYNPKDMAKLLSNKTNISYIRGNCDADVDQMVLGKDLTKKEKLFIFNTIKVYAIHGYEETEEERIDRATKLGAKFLVSGHSHIKVLKRVKELIVINPGSTSIPKDEIASIARITDKKVELIDIDRNKIISTITL
ncbi:MAG: phosphodiesterase [Lagierella massiliensis]|nr:phosphodiesterase [Lagierella massiliensis]